jgi:hypothetical protein
VQCQCNGRTINLCRHPSLCSLNCPTE